MTQAEADILAEQVPMDRKRAALESRYYDEAMDLCDLVPLMAVALGGVR